MKKITLFFLLVMIFLPIHIKAEVLDTPIEYGNYDDTQKIVKEVMKAYYMRGPYIQYNYAKTEYGKNSPEESTTQDTNYLVCAAYTYGIYVESFGVNRESPDSTKYSYGFPEYNYDITADAKKYYDKNKNILSAENNNLEGKYLIWYSENDTPNNATGEEYNDVGEVNNNVSDSNTKYIKGNSTNFSDFIQQIKPGDLLGVTGHAMIAYDITINPETGKQDVLLLHSNIAGWIRTTLVYNSNKSLSISQAHNRLFYNIYPNGYHRIKEVRINNDLNNENEGTIQWIWLSEYSHMVKNDKMECDLNQCAIIRPFYKNENGNAVFNYKINTTNYNNSLVRIKYPSLMIEKTVNKQDNNSVNIGDELTYTIKITNKSYITNKEQSYTSFSVGEELGEYVEYVSSSNNGIFNSNKITWDINGLAPRSSVTMTYTVKVKEDVTNINKTIISKGKFYSKNSNGYITTGTVENKIIPKTSAPKKNYNKCYEELKNTKEGLNLINEIYKCARNQDFNFNDFNFENIINKKKGTTAVSSLWTKAGISNVITLKNGLTGKNLTFSNMILNNYWGGTAVFSEKIDNYYLQYYNLPFWSGNSALRANTINPKDFKEGDVLIYYIDTFKYRQITYNNLNPECKDIFTLNNDKYTFEGKTDNTCINDYNIANGTTTISDGTQKNRVQNGIYAFIYINGKFVGINNASENPKRSERNEFTASPFWDNVTTISSAYTSLYYDMEVVNKYFENKETERQEFLDYTNYQTLFGMDYYVILRPEAVIKELNRLKIKTTPNKAVYIQNYEDLNLEGGLIELIYNDGTIENVNIDNENIKVSGFDNSKIGTNKIKVEYLGHEDTFDVEIVSKQVTNIEVTTLPTKTKYIEESENLDLSGGILKVTYNDNSIDTIALDNPNIIINNFDNKKIGINIIEVEYLGKKTTFNVEIIKKEINKIKVTTLPTKKTYIQNYEKLDLSGGILSIIYNDNSTSTINLNNKDIKVSGFDNSKIGTNTIKVEYLGNETTFNVEIIKKEVKKIKITTLPTKKTYIQNYEKLDLSGGELTITYNDNSTSIISLNNKNIKVSGFNNSKIGINNIKIKYMGYEDTFNVEIISKQIIKIEISTLPVTTQYKLNSQKLDLNGGIITVTFNDKTTAKIGLNDKNVTTSGFESSKIGKKTITVTYLGNNTTFNIYIVDKRITNPETNIIKIIKEIIIFIISIIYVIIIKNNIFKIKKRIN